METVVQERNSGTRENKLLYKLCFKPLVLVIGERSYSHYRTTDDTNKKTIVQGLRQRKADKNETVIEQERGRWWECSRDLKIHVDLRAFGSEGVEQLVAVVVVLGLSWKSRDEPGLDLFIGSVKDANFVRCNLVRL